MNKQRQVVFGIFLFAAFVGLLVAVQKVPEWQVKRASVRSTAVKPEATTTPAEIANLQNEMRKTFVQVLGGLFVMGALWLTYRRTKVTEQGHITDRYTKAIEQLGATKDVKGETEPNIEVRLGAIYALERIALDSPRDHWTIMEVLTAYLRENASPTETPETEEQRKKVIENGPATENCAILAVLGRRRRDKKRERSGQVLDLRKTDLRGANLHNAHLETASFDQANLEAATFHGAHVEEATFERSYGPRTHFSGTNVKRASFKYANVEEADFNGASLEGAIFEGASLKDTRFINAHLELANFKNVSADGADFSGAYLQGAIFHAAHLEKAIFDGAHLEGADFSNAYLEGARLSQAFLEKTRFLGTELLTAEQVRRARDWEKATYTEALKRELGLASGAQQTVPNRSPIPPDDQVVST